MFFSLFAFWCIYLQDVEATKYHFVNGYLSFKTYYFNHINTGFKYSNATFAHDMKDCYFNQAFVSIKLKFDHKAKTFNLALICFSTQKRAAAS